MILRRTTNWTVLALSAAMMLLAACAQGEPFVPIDVEATVAAAVEATVAAQGVTGEPAQAETGQTGTPEAIAAAEQTSPAPTPVMLITPTPDRTAEVMQLILSKVRHIRGDPEATVAIVEFSDFQ